MRLNLILFLLLISFPCSGQSLKENTSQISIPLPVTLSDSLLLGLKSKINDKITEYTQEMIKRAVALILAENQALIQELQEKDDEIEKLEKSENVWKWVAAGSAVIAGIGIVYIVADNIR